MSYESVFRRFQSYWWVILGITIAFTLFLFPWSTDSSYVGSITVGIQFNNPELVELEDAGAAYSDAFDSLSLYLEQRFSSVEIQKIIAESADLDVSNINNRRPFYSVTNQGSAFVTLSYTSQNKEDVERFNQAVGDAYRTLVGEWNDARLEQFTITPMQNFTQVVTEVQRPPQLQILPTFSGAVVGVLLVLILPEPKSIQTKSKTKKS